MRRGEQNAPSARARVTVENAWLKATWPFVHGQLPAAPAAVLEIGCGPLGGFVPALFVVEVRASSSLPPRVSTCEQCAQSRDELVPCRRCGVMVV